MNWIEEKVKEYDVMFQGMKERPAQEIQHILAMEFVKKALQEAQRQERERIVEWVKKKHNKVYKVVPHYIDGSIETITIPDGYDSAFRLGESITLDDLLTFLTK